MAGHSMIDPTTLPLRPGLKQAQERGWVRLASPGTWWTGAERIAIAAGARRAMSCALCARRKAALSPYAEQGSHDHDGTLPEAVVEVVHRLTTDASRLKQSWLRAMLEDGLSDAQYVEIVGVIAMITALDTFDRALGHPVRNLPVAKAGDPTRRRPRGAKPGLAWVPTVAPDDMTADDVNPYPVHGEKNIHRALSLVPQEVMNFFNLDVELYLKDHEIRDFDTEYRALSHPQIELLAGRVSALNGCYY